MQNYPTSHAEAAALFEDTRGAKTRGTVKIDYNTYVERFDTQAGMEYGVRYHSTVIVRYKIGGVIEIDSGGWIESPTTRGRFNRALPAGVDCGRNGGIDYLAIRKPGSESFGSWRVDWARTVWQDDTTLHPEDGGFRIEAPDALEDADEAARLRRNALARDRYRAKRDGTPLEMERQRGGSFGRSYTPPTPRAASIRTSDSFDPVTVDFLILTGVERASIIPKSKRAADSLSTETRTVKIGEVFSVSRETAIQAAAVAVENRLEVIVEDA